MSERIHALAQLLLGKASIEECSLEEIKQLTDSYPYFAPAQFLLLQKLKTESSSEAVAQRQKAILYYPDPLHFDYFVSPEKFEVDSTFLFEEKSVHKEIFPEDVTESAGSNTEYVEDKTHPEAAEEITEPGLNETESQNSIAALPTNEDPVDDALTFNTAPTTVESETEENINETKRTETSEEEIAVDQIENVAVQEPSDLAEIVAADEPLENDETTVQNSPKTFEHSETIIPIIGHNSLSNKQAKAVQVPAGEEALAFEPYYTVDYFASQGIKVSAEELPKDKLGKQLRSFTEWLRIMKRLPAGELTKTPETTAEKTVERLANHSVANNDVVTEAMAEVWAKQGANEKAIETYNKLCLLNPSKRAYFAAKIENLKQS